MIFDANILNQVLQCAIENLNVYGKEWELFIDNGQFKIKLMACLLMEVSLKFNIFKSF